MAAPALLDEVIEQLSEAGLHPHLERVGADDESDVLLLHVADQDLRVPIKVRGSVTPATASAVRAQLARRGFRDGLLITEYVSVPAAERLRSLGLHFADTAGNMYLSAPGVLIWVTGRRRDTARRSRRASRAFRPSGLRIGMCLLSDPGLVDEPYRTIAEAAGVSIGSIQVVMKDLEELGHVAVRKQRRHLVDRDRFLDTWTGFYADVLRPRLELGRFRSPQQGWWRDVTASDHGVLWGGETAGALLTGNLRPEIATVYTPALPKQLLLQQRLARDPDGDVEIRRRFWRRDLPSPRPDVVPAPLVYADLLAVGDSRTAETAELVRAQHLA